MSMRTTLPDVIAGVMADVEQEGMDCLSEWPMGDLVSFRGIELAGGH